MKKQLFHTLYILFILITIYLFTGCHSKEDNLVINNEEVDQLLEDARTFMFNNPDSATIIMERILDPDKNKATAKQKCKAYTQLGIIYSIKKNIPASDSLFKKSLEILETEEDSISRASLYINLGINQSRQGHYQSSIDYYRKAEQIALHHIEGENLLNRIANNLGLAYKATGQLDSARYYYQLTLDKAIKAENKDLEANALLNLASIFHQYKEYTQAEKNLNQAITLYEEVDNKNGVIMALNNLATTFSSGRKFDDALETFIKAENLATSIGLKSQLGSTYHNIGNIYFKKEDYRKSREFLHKSLEIKYQNNDSIGIARSYNAFSAIYNRLKEYDNAEKYAKQALGIAERANNVDLLLDIYTNLSNALALKGKWDDAMTMTDLKDELKDSIFNKQKFEAIQELQIKYETDQKEQEIQHAKTTIGIQKKITILLLLLFLVLCICFVLVYYFQRKKLQYHIRIVKQDEELSRQIEKNHTNPIGNNINNNGINEDKANEILSKLHELFEEDKIYHIQGLDIVTVAEKIGTNRDYLSKAINKNLQKSFTEYLNYYRIHEAKEILRKQCHGNHLNLTMQTIAEQTGFSSTSTFYSVFKQQVGITPHEYKKTIKHTGQ